MDSIPVACLLEYVHSLQLAQKSYFTVPQKTTICSIEIGEEHFVDVTHMACAPRQVSPAWRELLCFSFALLHNKLNTLICCSRGQQAPSHPYPDLPFPLCWAQCSFLAARTLIMALLAYLGLAETKHDIFDYLLTGEVVAAFCGKLSPHVRHDRHVLSQESWEERRESLSVHWILTSLCWRCSVCWRDTEGEDDGCGGFFPCLLNSFFLCLSARGQFVCWHRRVSCVCFHACLLYDPALQLHECGEQVGSAGANEMYHWPHNPAALNTLVCVCVCTHGHWPQTHTEPITPSNLCVEPGA